MARRPPTDIPATEARERISEVISRVSFGGERVVISRNGKPLVAVISLADLERLKKLDPELEAIRQRALSALDTIREASAKDGTADLTDDEIEAEIAASRRERKARASRAVK